MVEVPGLLSDLFQAYLDARKHKRNTHNQLAFELHIEHHLMQLYDDLLHGTYEILPSIYFIQHYPVKREIFAGSFRDRVVHHLVYNYISPIFEKLFIYDSYSCRKGKGTSMGVQRVAKFMRSCSENYTQDCYILKLDIQGYFMAIDKEILYEKVCAKLQPHISLQGPYGERLLQLIHQIIFNDPTETGIFKGRTFDYHGLPRTKSLFHAAPDCGLPIGNLTSQLFSNIYLNEFDHYIKEELAINYYGRYVDDFVLIHHDKQYLLSLIPQISVALKDIGLQLNANKIYLQHYSKGVSFLGTVIKPYRVYLKRATLGRWYQKICSFNQQLRLAEQMGDFVLYQRILEGFLPMMNSYLGFLSHYPSYKKRKQICESLVDKRFWDYYTFAPDYSLIFV